ncbi:MAG: hypothetical protein IJY89_02565 [Clostridia bacterium]|nr:hypothetical protein [Clostridia bacterium]
MSNNNNIVIDKETGEVLEMDFAKTDVDVDVKVAAEAAADASKLPEQPKEKEPETVQVKLLRYANGMENWYGEVQILLAPQYENGRNVTPLYSTKVTYTLKILDCYDKEKIIKAKPSTVYGEGVVRGLSFVRFTPCLLKGENRWVPEKGATYWISFEAVGTDGKKYVSLNEREIFLNAPPMSKGSAVAPQKAPVQRTGMVNVNVPVLTANGPVMQGAGGQSDDYEELSDHLDELSDHLDDLEDQICDVEGRMDDVEEQLTRIEGLLYALSAQVSDEGVRHAEAESEKRVRKNTTDRKALYQLLELEQRLSTAFSESIAGLAKPQSAEENAAYVEALSAVTASFEGQRQKIREQYGFLFGTTSKETEE